MRKVGRNLALGIYTAVFNPITLEGRHVVCNSALLHEDLSTEVGTLGVPLVLLQSTEDLLVNPANVDPFLRCRSSIYHFWSHEFRKLPSDRSSEGCTNTTGVEALSVYGRKGLTDLLRALSKPRGTFVAWVRAGHEVRQESKHAVMDLLDALAKPTPEYTGVDAAEVAEDAAGGTLGLYPSPDFVAKVNGKQRVGAKVAPRTSAEGTVVGSAAPDGRKSVFQGVDADGVAVRVGGSSKRRREATKESTREAPTKSPQTTATNTTTMTALVSPFPQNIHTPALPSATGRGVADRAPMTSPIKKTCTRISAVRRDRNTGNPQSTAVAKPTAAFPLSDDEGSERDRQHADRTWDVSHPWRPLGVQATSESGATSRSGIRGVGEVSRGIGNGPTLVWEEKQSSTGSAPSLSHETPQHGNGTAGAPTTAASSLTGVAALRHDDADDGDCDARHGGDTDCYDIVLGGQRTCSSTIRIAGSDSSDKYTRSPSSAAPSLELLTSDASQRRGRRWMPSTGDGGVVVADSATLNCESSDDRNYSNAETKEVGASALPSNADAVTTEPLNDVFIAEACLEDRLCVARKRAAKRRQDEEAAAERRIAGIQEEQEMRSKAYAAEDEKMIGELEEQLAVARMARAPADLQRAVDGADVDDEIARNCLISPTTCSASPRVTHFSDMVAGSVIRSQVSVAFAEPSRAMPPIDYLPMEKLPEEFQRARDAYSLMADAARDHEEMKRLRKEAGVAGGGDLAQFQRDQARAAVKRACDTLPRRDFDLARREGSIRVQSLVRGVLGRRRVALLRSERNELNRRAAAAVVVQTAARGLLQRQRVRRTRDAAMAELVFGEAAGRLQRVSRGMLGRRRAVVRRRDLAVLTVQRCYRGHLGRTYATRQQATLEELRTRQRCAIKIQAWWRCKCMVDAYASRLAFALAVVEIQRIYRGVIGRRTAKHRRAWAAAAFGPEKLKLGMRLIEDTKVTPAPATSAPSCDFTTT